MRKIWLLLCACAFSMNASCSAAQRGAIGTNPQFEDALDQFKKICLTGEANLEATATKARHLGWSDIAKNANPRVGMELKIFLEIPDFQVSYLQLQSPQSSESRFLTLAKIIGPKGRTTFNCLLEIPGWKNQIPHNSVKSLNFGELQDWPYKENSQYVWNDKDPVREVWISRKTSLDESYPNSTDILPLAGLTLKMVTELSPNNRAS